MFFLRFDGDLFIDVSKVLSRFRKKVSHQFNFLRVEHRLWESFFNAGFLGLSNNIRFPGEEVVTIRIPGVGVVNISQGWVSSPSESQGVGVVNIRFHVMGVINIIFPGVEVIIIRIQGGWMSSISSSQRVLNMSFLGVDVVKIRTSSVFLLSLVS